MTFHEYYCRLCERRGTTPSAAAESMGLSRAAVSKWKNGSVPGIATLQRLSAYFGVPVGDLLEHRDPAVDPAQDNPADFTYALYNELMELTPEQQSVVLRLAREFKKDVDQKGE